MTDNDNTVGMSSAFLSYEYVHLGATAILCSHVSLATERTKVLRGVLYF